MEDPDTVVPGFAPAELTAVENAAIKLASGHRRSALRLAASWAANIEKIDADRARSGDDRSAWTDHDLAGALFVRDLLESALGQLPEGLREKVRELVSQTDVRFRSFTVDDPSGLMARVALVDRAGRGWWWSRVPADGPIAADLACWPGVEAAPE
jgi:hypothetical protein